MTLNILGTSYEIIVKKYDEEESFETRHIDGYCNSFTKEIVVCDMHTYKGWENESEKAIIEAQKMTLRHEIVHAFFDESGLQDNANEFCGAWPTNEELVDWIALQGTKIYKAWEEANAI